MHKRGAMMMWISALIGGGCSGRAREWRWPPEGYVGLFKDDAVAVIDTAQNKVVGTIPVPKGPHGLVSHRTAGHQ